MAYYCPECGIPLQDGVRFCMNCGASALEQVLIWREKIEPTSSALGQLDEPPGVIKSAEPASSSLEEDTATSGDLTSSQVAEKAMEETQPVPPQPAVKTGSVEARAAAERPELRIELESAGKPTLKDLIFSLRLIVDRQKLMWQAVGNITAWVFFLIFSLLAYVVADQSQMLSILLRLLGWGVFIVLLLVTAAAIAAAVVSEMSAHFQLEVKTSSALLTCLPAIVGPAVLFLGLAVLGVGLLAALGVAARFEGSGEILWSALALPQFVIALSTVFLLLIACASFVYGPALAVTDGASLSQALVRFFLIFRRDFKRAAGYFLLVAVFSLLVSVIVWGIAVLLLRWIDLVAAETSDGRTTTIIALGSDLAVRLLPGGLPGLMSGDAGRALSFLQGESGMRIASFFWAFWLVIISAIVATLPLLSLNVTGAAATSILLARLAHEPVADKREGR